MTVAAAVIEDVREGALRRVLRYSVEVVGADGSKLRCSTGGAVVGAWWAHGSARVFYARSTPRRLGSAASCRLVAVEREGGLYLVDPRLAHSGFRVYAEEKGWSLVASEPVVQGARLDYLAYTGEGLAAVEVKHTSLVRGGAALFPQSRSERLVRQLESMIVLYRAAGVKPVLFVAVTGGEPRAVRAAAGVDHRAAKMLCAARGVVSYGAALLRGVVEGGRLKVFYEGELPFEPCA